MFACIFRGLGGFQSNPAPCICIGVSKLKLRLQPDIVVLFQQVTDRQNVFFFFFSLEGYLVSAVVLPSSARIKRVNAK